MAVPPKFAGQKLFLSPPRAWTASAPSSPHTLELYLDYCCPFSARLFNTLTTGVIPALRSASAPPADLCFVFRQQVQPWHPSSTLMHEAGLAVLRLSPARFWEFSRELFAAQRGFFDVSVAGETRNQTYRRLAAVAGMVGVDANKVYELLRIPEAAEGAGEGGDENAALNVGNGVTDDLKLVTRMNRMAGVHVTPTVVFNGVVQGDVSSSWTLEQWMQWIGKNVV